MIRNGNSQICTVAETMIASKIYAVIFLTFSRRNHWGFVDLKRRVDQTCLLRSISHTSSRQYSSSQSCVSHGRVFGGNGRSFVGVQVPIARKFSIRGKAMI